MKPKKYFLILLILILTQSINADKDNIKYGVNVSKVQGNTARYRYFATFDVWLKSQPRANVTIPLSSSDINEGKIVEGDKLIFTSDNWNKPQTVVVQGQNQNVVNGIQNYTIILDSIISDDDNYDGIDPDDVEMKGLELILKQQENLTCIAGFKKRIKIESEYNGQKSLSYTLIEKPDGMIINTRTGKISWTAPQIAEGSSYPVKVKVSDGLFTREISFNITVVNSTPIETEVNGTVVIVTDVNHLNGFKFRFTEGSSIPTIKTISEDSLPLLSNGITRLSDYFYSLDEHDGRVEILMPLSILNNMNDASRLVIYHDSYQEGWLSLPVELKIEDIENIKYISISISTLKGSVFFVGLMPKIKNH